MSARIAPASAPQGQRGQQMVYLFTGRTIAFALTFALPLILARLFPPEKFGLYKQLFLIHATLASILTFGFSSSLFYFVPRESDGRHRYESQTLLALFALALVGAAALIALKSQIARALNDPALESYIPYLAALTGLSLITTPILESLMIIFKQARLSAATSLVSELLRAGLMIGAAMLTHNMLDILLAALAWAVFRFIALMAYLRAMHIPVWTKPDRDCVVEQIRYAFPFGLAVIALTLSVSLHQYMVSYLYTPAMFAIYSVGYLQVPIVAIAFESVADVTLVQLTELRHAGMLGEAARLLGESVTKLCMFLLPLYVWFTVSAGDLIVLLFTDRYKASVQVFRIFLIMIPIVALSLDYVPRAFAHTGFILRVNIVRLVLNALLLGLAVPLGLVGAALATVLATAIAKGIILIKVKNLLRVPFHQVLPWRRLGKIAAVSVMAGGAAWMLNTAAPFGIATRLVLSGGLYTLSYAVLAWTSGLIEPSGKRRVMAVVAVWSK
jgi:O-antigen/teichoic acid export membrane protein